MTWREAKHRRVAYMFCIYYGQSSALATPSIYMLPLERYGVSYNDQSSYQSLERELGDVSNQRNRHERKLSRLTGGERSA